MTHNKKSFNALKAIAASALLVLACGLFGCATGPTADPRDPLEPLNRTVSRFNESVDNAVLKPVAQGYRSAVPRLVRVGVSNFFDNMEDAWSFVNGLLQLRPGIAADNYMRVVINTFFGFGGVLDIASELGIERHSEDFGQTLGRWGVPAGPYVVLPLLGPSTLRDTAAIQVDVRGDPVRGVKNVPGRNSLYALRVVDQRASFLRAGDLLDQAALDKYSFTRDVFLQRRRAEVFTDKPGGDKPDADKPEAEPAAPAK